MGRTTVLFANSRNTRHQPEPQGGSQSMARRRFGSLAHSRAGAGNSRRLGGRCIAIRQKLIATRAASVPCACRARTKALVPSLVASSYLRPPGSRRKEHTFRRCPPTPRCEESQARIPKRARPTPARCVPCDTRVATAKRSPDEWAEPHDGVVVLRRSARPAATPSRVWPPARWPGAASTPPPRVPRSVRRIRQGPCRPTQKAVVTGSKQRRSECVMAPMGSFNSPYRSYASP